MLKLRDLYEAPLRNLKEDKVWVESVHAHYNGDLSEIDIIVVEALDRAIAAESEVARLNETVNDQRTLIEAQVGHIDTVNAHLEKLNRRLERCVETSIDISDLKDVVASLNVGEEVLRELYSSIGQDIDINPSAKRVYLSKVEHIRITLLNKILLSIEGLSALKTVVNTNQ